jgi:hypothetical protein
MTIIRCSLQGEHGPNGSPCQGFEQSMVVWYAPAGGQIGLVPE